MGRESTPKYWLPWLVGMPAETCRAVCSMIFGGVFERLPNLRVCFAHGGGSFPATIGRIEQGFLVRPDLTQVDCKVNPKDYLGKFWVDSLVHDDKYLKFVLDVMGKNRVTLGSDYPFPLGEHVPGKMIEDTNELDQETKEKILCDNAFEFLGLKKEKFILGNDDQMNQ